MRPAVNPAGLDDARLTAPVNPLTDATVTTDTPELPSDRVREIGLAVKVKPETFTVTSTVWVNDPLFPVTSTE